MTEMVIHLDEVDYRLLEGYLDNMRKVLSLEKLGIEDAALFCIKKALYSEDKSESKAKGQ